MVLPLKLPLPNGIHGVILRPNGRNQRRFALSNMLQLNALHAVAVVFDCEGGIMRCFLDGDKKGEWGMETGDIPGTPVTVWVGEKPEGYQHLTCYLAGVALYDRPLTGEEASFNLVGRRMVVTRGLTPWLPLDEGSKAHMLSQSATPTRSR